MNYLDTIIFTLLVGFIFGVFKAWNRKIFFLFFVLLVTLTIVAYIAVPPIAETIPTEEVGKFILGMLFAGLGIHCGEIAYEEVWK